VPLAITISVSTPGAVLLVALLVVAFTLGRSSGKRQQPQLPSKADLEAMTETLKAMTELGDKIAGWKAAIYGAVGVVLGALGGLAAEFVTSGHISPEEFERIGIVLGGLVAAATVVIYAVEKLRLVERLIKK
jgi:hypothetical protein